MLEFWLAPIAALGVWALWSGRPLLMLGVALSALALLSLAVWRRFSLAGVLYRRRLSAHRAAFGDTVELTAELLNLKPLPLTWLRVEDVLPANLTVTGAGVRGAPRDFFHYLLMVVAVLPYQRITRRLRIACNRRGDHQFGSTSLESGDYLGVLRDYGTAGEIDRLLVFPKVFSLVLGRAPTNQLLGRDALRRNVLVDPSRTIGARQYQPGDPYKTIDWRASARSPSLMVRVFEASTTPTLDIVLDFAVPRDAAGGYDDDRLEFAISVAASLAAHGSQRGWAVGLRANGRSNAAAIDIAPSAAPDQFRLIAEVLARADARANRELAELLRAPRRKATRDATLVLIAAVIEPRVLGLLLDLKRRGRAVLAIHAAALDDATPRIPGLSIIRARYDRNWTEQETLVLGA